MDLFTPQTHWLQYRSVNEPERLAHDFVAHKMCRNCYVLSFEMLWRLIEKIKHISFMYRGFNPNNQRKVLNAGKKDPTNREECR